MDSCTIREARPEDAVAVFRLLEQCGLSKDGIDYKLSGFLVATSGGLVVGTVGMEYYGQYALLRSLAVSQESRGRGLGKLLVEHALRRAGATGVNQVYLLTTTAKSFFERLGFVSVERSSVPSEVKGSLQFRETCPVSATVMRRVLST